MSRLTRCGDKGYLLTKKEGSIMSCFIHKWADTTKKTRKCKKCGHEQERNTFGMWVSVIPKKGARK